MMNAREFFRITPRNIAGVVSMLLLFAGYHVVRIQMTKLDEDIVYAHYQESINATRMFDAKTLCAMMDKDYRGVDVLKTPQGEKRTLINQVQACDATRESMKMMKKIVAATKLEPEFKYTIESVELSPDRKEASVKIRASMRIGKQLSVSTTGTETLVRRWGNVYSTFTNTRSTVSVR
jgi:hypothetical protein